MCGCQSTQRSRVQRFLWVTCMEIAQSAAFCIYPWAMLDAGCWKQLGSVPGPAAVSLTQAGVRKCFLQRNRCQAKLLRLFCQRCGGVLAGGTEAAGAEQCWCHISGDSTGWPRHPEDTAWQDVQDETVTPPCLAAKL